MEVLAIIISALALVVSVVSFIFSNKSQSLQDKVNELELIIKKAEVEVIEKEKANKDVPCVEARFVRISDKKKRIRVWNSGNATAYNVKVSIPEEYGVIIFTDKIPYEMLESNKSFDNVAIIHNGSASTFKIITEWEDDKGNKYKKEQMGDI